MDNRKFPIEVLSSTSGRVDQLEENYNRSISTMHQSRRRRNGLVAAFISASVLFGALEGTEVIDGDSTAVNLLDLGTDVALITGAFHYGAQRKRAKDHAEGMQILAISFCDSVNMFPPEWANGIEIVVRESVPETVDA